MGEILCQLYIHTHTLTPKDTHTHTHAHTYHKVLPPKRNQEHKTQINDSIKKNERGC